MTLTVELPNYLADAVQAQALKQGIEPAGLICRVLEHALPPQIQKNDSDKPLKTGRGMFAAHGSAPSAEEIDVNRAERLHGFAENF